MGKFQKVKKVKREFKELKICFPKLSLEAIKDEAVPLILTSITNYLNVDEQNSLIMYCFIEILLTKGLRSIFLTHKTRNLF
jgi:hypothetical protein